MSSLLLEVHWQLDLNSHKLTRLKTKILSPSINYKNHENKREQSFECLKYERAIESSLSYKDILQI